MSKPTATAKPSSTLKTAKNQEAAANGPRQQFLMAALNMSWQLAIVVLVPIIGGVELGRALKHSTAFTIGGLVVAFFGSGVVMWRAMQAANRLPVPKLTAEQRRDIKRQYEEEDNE